MVPFACAYVVGMQGGVRSRRAVPVAAVESHVELLLLGGSPCQVGQ